MNRPQTTTVGPLGRGSSDADGQAMGSHDVFAFNVVHDRIYSPDHGHPDSGDSDGIDGVLGHGESAPNARFALGEVGMMGDLQETVGLGLDAAVPAGEGSDLEVEVEATVAADLVVAGVSAKLSAERSEDGFEVAGEVGLKVGLGTALNHVALEAKVGVSGAGDDAVEAMDLVGLAVEQTIRPRTASLQDLLAEVAEKGLAGAIFSQGLGNWVADELWGKGYAHAVVENMDDDDEARVTRGIGLEASGGEEGVDLHASAGVESDDVWKKGEDGELDRERESRTVLLASLGIEAEGVMFDLEGKMTFPGVDDVVFDLKLGVGASEVEAAAVARGAQEALDGLSEIASHLGGVFGAVVGHVCEALDATSAATGNYREVEASYDSKTGQLDVTARTKVVVSEKEDDDELAVSFRGSRGQANWSHRFDVGRL